MSLTNEASSNCSLLSSPPQPDERNILSGCPLFPVVKTLPIYLYMPLNRVGMLSPVWQKANTIEVAACRASVAVGGRGELELSPRCQTKEEEEEDPLRWLQQQ
jgi:hypothetical protein